MGMVKISEKSFVRGNSEFACQWASQSVCCHTSNWPSEDQWGGGGGGEGGGGITSRSKMTSSVDREAPAQTGTFNNAAGDAV